MFRKFFSSALFKFVIDKKARDKIISFYAKKHTLKVQAHGFNSIPRNTELPDDTATTVAAALHNKEQNMLDRSNGEKPKSTKLSDRRALINQAMAIRRSKLHILDELDPEQLKKLKTMAIQALNIRIQK